MQANATDATCPRSTSTAGYVTVALVDTSQIILIDQQSLTQGTLTMNDVPPEKVEAEDSDNVLRRLFATCTAFVRSPVTKAMPAPLPSRRLSKKQRKMSQHQGSQEGRRYILRSSRSKKVPKMADSPLYDSVVDKSFWNMPDEKLLELIRDHFPDELTRLKNAYSLKPTGIPRPKSDSISQRLYDGENFDEVNRTLVGVLALRWLWHDEYDIFVGCQPEAVRLKRDSFEWLRQNFKAGLKSPEDIYALVVTMIINDLGKDPDLAEEYANLKNIDISKVNHDMILSLAVDADLVPALNRIEDHHRQDIVKGIKLGSDFNFGQLAQAENAPASLAGLLGMSGQSRAFEVRFMEQILDLAGASGHEDWTCARKMIEPIFQSYQNVWTVATAIISGDSDLRKGYDVILTRKLDLLHRSGYDKDFDVTKADERAMMRLFCLGNTNNPQNAELYFTAFNNGISRRTRQTLIDGLNTDGSVEKPAIQNTYAPAMFTKATGNTPTGSREEKIRAISAVMTYLAKCFVLTKEQHKELPQGVTVIERDLRSVLEVVESEEFKKDPTCLEKEKAPEVQVANMAKS